MSESRRKLKKDEDKHLFSGKREEQEFLTSRMSIDLVRRKEEEVKEKIKRKKEELKMKHEELYRTIKSGIRDALRDEKGAAERYRVLANLCRRVGNEAMARILEKIANDEEGHFKDLNIIKIS